MYYIYGEKLKKKVNRFCKRKNLFLLNVVQTKLILPTCTLFLAIQVCRKFKMKLTSYCRIGSSSLYTDSCYIHVYLQFSAISCPYLQITRQSTVDFFFVTLVLTARQVRTVCGLLIFPVVLAGLTRLALSDCQILDNHSNI